MKNSSQWDDLFLFKLYDFASRYSGGLMLGAIGVMAVNSTFKLVPGFMHLVVETSTSAPIDLQYYYNWVHQWFARLPVYNLPEHPEYPPASMTILFPLVGWLAIEPARWWWAITAAIALVVLSFLIIRQSQAANWRARIFVALMLFSTRATGVALGNGQLILHVLPLLLVGLLLLHRQPRGWRVDLVAAALLLLTLVKPSISAPFLWLAIFVRGELRVRPIMLLGLGYLVLTVFSAGFQDMPLWDLIVLPIRNGEMLATSAGYANIQIALSAIGLEKTVLPASLLVFFGLGAWVHYYRKIDFWILLSVAALIARVWTYHRIYDNVLILIPEVALYRIIQRGSLAEPGVWRAGVLLGLNVLVMLAPGSLTLIVPWWDRFLETADTIAIVLDLIFFLNVARRAKPLGLASERTTAVLTVAVK